MTRNPFGAWRMKRTGWPCSSILLGASASVPTRSSRGGALGEEKGARNGPLSVLAQPQRVLLPEGQGAFPQLGEKEPERRVEEPRKGAFRPPVVVPDRCRSQLFCGAEPVHAISLARDREPGQLARMSALKLQLKETFCKLPIHRRRWGEIPGRWRREEEITH